MNLSLTQKYDIWFIVRVYLRCIIFYINMRYVASKILRCNIIWALNYSRHCIPRILSNQIYIINYLTEKIAVNIIKIHSNEYIWVSTYYLKLVEAISRYFTLDLLAWREIQTAHTIRSYKKIFHWRDSCIKHIQEIDLDIHTNWRLHTFEEIPRKKKISKE